MAVTTTLAALRTLHAGITGITTATTTFPAALNAGDLPAVLTWPGPATHNPQTIGQLLSLKRVSREYVVQLFVAPVGAGAGLDENAQKVLPFFDRFHTAYLNDPTLAGTDVEILDDYGEWGDEGLTNLRYANEEYWGTVFRLKYIEKST